MNCTSDQHEWFKKALDGDEKYRNYYYFSDGVMLGKPNNWNSFSGGSAWAKTESGDYYMHLLGKNQPELNWENPDVYNEFVDIMKFWMDKGIAGFRLDTVNVLYKNSRDNGKFSLLLTGKEHYLHTEGTHDILKRLNKDVWSGYKSFMVGETVLTEPEQAKLLCDDRRGELDAVFFFGRLDIDCKHCRSIIRRRNIQKLICLVDKGQSSIDFPINYLETGSDAHYVKFFGDDKTNCRAFEKMLTGLNLSLKGIPFISQGCDAVHEEAIDDPTSLFTFCSKMIEFRKNSKALLDGTYRRIASQNDVYIFTREAVEERLYVYCNFTGNNTQVEFYGDRLIFSNYNLDNAQNNILKPYEFRIVASNI